MTEKRPTSFWAWLLFVAGLYLAIAHSRRRQCGIVLAGLHKMKFGEYSFGQGQSPEGVTSVIR